MQVDKKSFYKGNRVSKLTKFNLTQNLPNTTQHEDLPMANDKCINALYEKYALPQDNLRYCTIIYSNIKKFKSRYIARILALWYTAKNYKLFKVSENRMLWGQHCSCSSMLNYNIVGSASARNQV